VTACTVTPDGQYVVSASYDHTLKVWELASGRPVATLQSHPWGVTACAVMPDGRHLVAASYDHTLKAWELANGRPVAHVPWSHQRDAGYLAVAVTATIVIAGDMTVGVWFLDMPWSKHPQRVAHGGASTLARTDPALLVRNDPGCCSGSRS